MTAATPDYRPGDSGVPKSRFFGGITGNEPFYPLFILFFLNTVDELDRVAFDVLLPNIRDYFHLSSAGALGLVALTAPFSILLGLAVGFFGDRLKRTPFVTLGATAWGGFSLLTGLANSVGVLAIARAGSGMGKVVNGPMHQSLIADYYYPVDRPKVYAVYNAGNPVGRIIGPVAAGLLAASFTWRTPFIFFAFLTAAGVLMSFLLREPIRGRLDRLVAGANERIADTEARAPSFGESWRLLYTVGTIRRLYFTIPLLAASFIGITATVSLYYERVHGVDEAGRGLIIALDEPFALLGLFVGAPIATRLMARDPGLGLKLVRYLAFGSGTCIFLMAIAPTVPFAVAASVTRAALSASLSPMIAATLSMVMPPRARALGYSVFGLWYLPSLLMLPIIGRIGDLFGFRIALLIFVPMYLLGTSILSTASKSVVPDIENNQRHEILEAEAQAERIRFREAVASGEVDENEFALLDARDIHLSYGSVKVLFGVDLEVKRGDRIALLGTNGAGKSTLLKVLSGLMTPDPGTGGSVWYKNNDITFLSPADRVNLGIIQIGGGRATFPTLSVDENLRIGAYQFLDKRDLVNERVDEVMDLFPVLRSRAGQPAGTLSGGEQQMMALGRAFIAGPELLIIDELALGLAPIVMEEILRIVEEMVERGTTLILVEQSLNVALMITDHAYFMEKGEIVLSGDTASLVQRDDIVRSVFFGKTGAGQ